jgi:hypothetical protein
MKTLTNYLKSKYSDLPDNWHVYSARIVDGDGDEIIQAKGAIARTLQRGKNKGRLTWDGGGKRTFLLPIVEYRSACDDPEIEKAEIQQELVLY